MTSAQCWSKTATVLTYNSYIRDLWTGLWVRVFDGICEFLRWSFFTHASVVQRLDSAIHRVNLYPVDSPLSLPSTYLLDSDLSGGERYPTFEQPGAWSFLLRLSICWSSSKNLGSSSKFLKRSCLILLVKSLGRYFVLITSIISV